MLQKPYANPFMAKIKLAADFSDFSKWCQRNNVRFMVIGCYAIIPHSRPRRLAGFTGKLHEPRGMPENLKRNGRILARPGTLA